MTRKTACLRFQVKGVRSMRSQQKKNAKAVVIVSHAIVKGELRESAESYSPLLPHKILICRSLPIFRKSIDQRFANFAQVEWRTHLRPSISQPYIDALLALHMYNNIICVSHLNHQTAEQSAPRFSNCTDLKTAHL